MERKNLIVNIGSTSKKYALYFEKELVRFTLNNDLTGKYKVNGNWFEIKIKSTDYLHSVNFIIDFLIKNYFITTKNEISKIAVRIVSPGVYFQKHRLIDSTFISKLKTSLDMAPLHIKPALEEINMLKKEFPKIKMYGISDSEFHSSLPDVTKYYGISKKHSDNLQIYRYGYHGISIRSVLRIVNEKLGKVPERIIVCHLGGGCSITAIKNSKSLDTSMGFTPLDGMIMSTRSGILDPSVVNYLSKTLKLNSDKIEEMLNNQSGLLGISGSESSVKELLKKSNENSKLAIDKFVYDIVKFVSSYYSILNGLDLIVFTGAIGAESVKIRKVVCDSLNCLGIFIDDEKNLDNNNFLQDKKSRVKILALETDEISEMNLILKEF